MQNLTDQTKDLLLTRSLILQRVSNSLTKDVKTAYIAVIDDLLSQIATGKNISLINMNKIIKELNAKLTPDLTSVNDDLVQLGISEASYVANGINGAIGIDLVSKLPTDRTVQKIVNTSLMDGLTISEWLGKQDKSFQETLTKQIRLAVIEGETNPQIVSRLKSALDIKNNNNIKTIVRTAVSTVTNQVRMETYKENEDVFKGYEHNSTLDGRTSLICSTRDGSEWDLEYKGLNEKGKAYPFKQVPLHFNCRSIILPITKTFRELGLDIDEIPSGTRSSIDGRVSSDTTFKQWFEGKSATFQESYLGKGRYQLFKDGKITFSDLVNQNGRTLSIAELSKITPIKAVTKVPVIDFGYDGKFNKYVENIRDEAKIVIDKLPKPTQIKEKNNSYEVVSKVLTISKKADNYMFNHEYGHHIDTMLSSKNKNNSLVLLSKSSLIDGELLKVRFPRKELYKLSDSDLMDELIRLDDVSKIEKQTLSSLKEKWFITTETDTTIKVKAKKSHINLFSDIVDSLTSGEFSRDYKTSGHGTSYFSIEKRKQQENFANLFSLWSDKTHWEETKTLFPNMTKDFENIMKEVIDGKFD